MMIERCTFVVVSTLLVVQLFSYATAKGKYHNTVQRKLNVNVWCRQLSDLNFSITDFFDFDYLDMEYFI